MQNARPFVCVILYFTSGNTGNTTGNTDNIVAGTRLYFRSSIKTET